MQSKCPEGLSAGEETEPLVHITMTEVLHWPVLKIPYTCLVCFSSQITSANIISFEAYNSAMR